jgi:hypothetical protein
MERLFRQPTEMTHAEIMQEQKTFYRVKKALKWKQKINLQDRQVYNKVLRQNEEHEQILKMPDMKLINHSVKYETFTNEQMAKHVIQLEYWKQLVDKQRKIVNSNLYTFKNRIRQS